MNEVFVTYYSSPSAFIIGPVFTEVEKAKQFIAKKGESWTWVGVGFDDPHFAGWIATVPNRTPSFELKDGNSPWWWPFSNG